MKKKNIYLLSLVILLSGCSASIPLEFIEYKPTDNILKTFIKEQDDIYYRNDDIKTLDIKHIDGVNIKTNKYSFSNLNDVSTAFDNDSYSLMSYNTNNINSYITQKILVAPIYFSDSSVVDDEVLKEEKKILIENAFFGEENKTNYQSVASYYNKSSYGHLRLEGEILDWTSVNQTSIEAYNEGKNSPENYSDKIARMIVDNLSEETFNKYSNNVEGVLDALYIIYDYPFQSDKKNSDDSLFWAYTYHCKNNSGSRKISAYCWSSFDFLGENVLKNHRVDASTFIHETGHLLGLLDYYNKGSNSYYQPLGFMDMMDYNLGDHSPFSKYLLNWTSPYILNMGNKNSGSITIKDFSSTGEFILIPKNDYNGTAFDRYLLISFFTPKGLNDLNNFPSYEYYDKEGNKGIFKFIDQYGVLVYEVNAKLGYYKSTSIRSYLPSYFVDEIPDKGDYVINFYYDNELNNSNDKPLYHLLESNGKNTFISGKSASNSTLFKFGDSFGINTFNDLAEEFGVTFSISKLTTKEARITFKQYKK